MTDDPLRYIERAETRGYETKKRRAWSEEELRLFLNTRPFYWHAVWLAARTGLRRSELQQMVWADLHLNTQNPFILPRSETTKNKQAQPIPLIPELLPVLEDLWTKEAKPTDRVLPYIIPRIKRIKKDVEKAGLIYRDALGRDLDFHALRYAWATFLARSGVTTRQLQALCRHSDPKLSANIYTDASQIDTFGAVQHLQPLYPPQKWTHIGTQSPDFGGQIESRPVTSPFGFPTPQPLADESVSRALARRVTRGRD